MHVRSRLSRRSTCLSIHRIYRARCPFDRVAGSAGHGGRAVLVVLASLALPIAEYYASRNRKQLLTTSKRVEGRASGDQQRQSESEEDGVDQDGERNASMPGRKWRREKQMKQRCKR